MKRIVLAAFALALVAINPAATAEPGWNGGGQGGGSYHGGGKQGGNQGGNDRGGGGYTRLQRQRHKARTTPDAGHTTATARTMATTTRVISPRARTTQVAGRITATGRITTPAIRTTAAATADIQSRRQLPVQRVVRPSGLLLSAAVLRAPVLPALRISSGGLSGLLLRRPYYYGHHHNNNNNSDWPAYLVGGAILGSVLTNVYHNSQAQQVAPANQVIAAPQGRRLLRDLNGNCYERTTDGYGNELRTELPPSQCNW